MSNDMSGALFKNDRKENERQPDYTGPATINGENLRVAAWIKENDRGKYLSLAFSVPQPREQRQVEPAAELGF